MLRQLLIAVLLVQTFAGQAVGVEMRCLHADASAADVAANDAHALHKNHRIEADAGNGVVDNDADDCGCMCDVVGHCSLATGLQSLSPAIAPAISLAMPPGHPAAFTKPAYAPAIYHPPSLAV